MTSSADGSVRGSAILHENHIETDKEANGDATSTRRRRNDAETTPRTPKKGRGGRWVGRDEYENDGGPTVDWRGEGKRDNVDVVVVEVAVAVGAGRGGKHEAGKGKGNQYGGVATSSSPHPLPPSPPPTPPRGR